MVNISRLPALLATLVSMVRVAATMVLSAALGSAPVQCGSSRGDADSALEETPGEALYQLAQRFWAEGDRDAWQITLQQLIERYPSSRFAMTARQDLADAGIAVVASDDSSAASD